MQMIGNNELKIVFLLFSCLSLFSDAGRSENIVADANDIFVIGDYRDIEVMILNLIV